VITTIGLAVLLILSDHIIFCLARVDEKTRPAFQIFIGVDQAARHVVECTWSWLSMPSDKRSALGVFLSCVIRVLLLG
jgi:hypothetical protein